MHAKRIVVSFLIGVLVTAVAAFLAIASAGGGHGHYVYAKIFFPYTLLGFNSFPATTIGSDYPASMYTPWMVLSLVQFPLYGITIGIASQKKYVFYLVCLLIVGIHVIASAMCFSGIMPEYS